MGRITHSKEMEMDELAKKMASLKKALLVSKKQVAGKAENENSLKEKEKQNKEKSQNQK